MDLKRESPTGSDPAEHDERASKRQRSNATESQASPTTAQEQPTDPYAANKTSFADLGRDGIQRAVSLALSHVGFDSASAEAMESFTAATETYLTTFIEHLKDLANSSRREFPDPTDFSKMLRRHNVPLSSLKPHLKNPIPKKKLETTFYNPIAADSEYHDPFQVADPTFLGNELSGKGEKEEKGWIPSAFPAFPSKHTYRFTAVEQKLQDPEKKRAEATADARKGEKALRRIDRAAKISRQREVRELANRNPLSKKRHDAWEAMMKTLLPGQGGSVGAFEIADHSTIVNAEMQFYRREAPRSSRKAGPDTIVNRG